MTIRSFLKAACITIAFSTGSALAGHHEKGEMPSQTIVEVAVGAEQVSTLVTAIKAASLVETLSGEGPFTVFAPTNEAFAKLPSALLKKLLEPANIKQLDEVLEYHVVAGAAVHAKDLKPEQQVKTLEGEELFISASSRDGVRINGVSKVTTADVDATNGVVHIIDHVLIPKHLMAGEV